MTARYITIHCSYSRPSQKWTAADIRRIHVEENGWSDIGYHFVIRRDGKRETGRPLARMGAHVAGHNEDNIGTCLIGGMKEDGSGPDCNFTKSQWRELEKLVGELKIQFPNALIKGHRDFDTRPCPTFDAQEWWKSR